MNCNLLVGYEVRLFLILESAFDWTEMYSMLCNMNNQS